MKRLARFLAVLILLFSFSTASFAGGHGGGGEGGHEKKKEKQVGNFSEKELDEMKQSQLLYYLSNSNYQSSEYAVNYFTDKGEAGISPLINHLKKNDDNEKIISAVLYTFGRIGPRAARAVPVLMKYLDHDNADIRKTAVAALGKIGKASDPAVPMISDYLNNENEWTRELAHRSLREIGTPQAKAIAKQYEKKLQLEEERKKAALLGTKIEEKVKEEPKKEKEKN